MSSKLQKRLNSSDEDDFIDEQPKSQTDKISFRATNFRWLVLILGCVLTGGAYVTMDFPAALQKKIENDFDINDKQYNLLYTLYSMPNIVMPLFGGMLIDRVGIKFGMILFTLILIAGQSISWIATFCQASAFPIMLIGRCIQGLGVESLGVVRMSFYAAWFLGKEYSFACGLNLSISRMGSVVSANLYPVLYNIDGTLHMPLFFGVCACCVSLLAALILVQIEKKADLIDQVEKKPAKVIRFQDLKELKLSFWLICISCCLNYICMFPWINNSQKFMISEFGMEDTQTGRYWGIPYLMSAFLTPFIGLFVDKCGRRGPLLIMTSGFMLVSHFIFLVMPTCPNGDCDPSVLILPYVLLGVFYCFIASTLWPCVAMVCKSDILGTAFGLILCIQNIGLCLGPLIVGSIIEATEKEHGYKMVSLFFVIVGVLCVLINALLWYIDAKDGNILNMSSSEAAKHSMLTKPETENEEESQENQ